MAKADLQYTIGIAGEAAQRYVSLWFSDIKNQTKELSDLIQKELGGPPIRKDLFVKVTTDSSGVKQITSEIKEVGRITDQWNNLLIQANKLQDGSVSKLRQQVNEAKQARDAIAKIGTSADDLKNKINSINPAWDAANQKVKALSRELEIASASSFWQRIKAEFNLGPIVGAGKALNEIVNTFQSLSIVVGQITAPINELSKALDEIQQINLLFKGIGAGPADIAKVFADSASIATTYGVSLKTVREGFTQLTPVVTASGGSMSDVSSIISALSSRFTTFGLSADKSRRVMNGVIQAFGKGKLMAEELTQQISEADPAFKTDLANAIGVSVAKLGELVKAGEITSDVLIKVLPLLGKNSEFFGKLGDSAGSAVAALGRGQATISQVQNQLASLSQLNLEALGGLFKPLLGAFLQVQAATIDFITQLRQLETIKFIIDVFNGVAQILATVFTAFTQLTVAIIKVVEPIAAAIRAFDNWTKTFTGIGLVSTALAALLTVQLYNAIYGLAVGLLPKAITAFTNLGVSINLVTVSSIRNFIASIGNTISSIAGYVAKIALVISGNTAMAASHDAVAAAAARQAAAQAAANGTPYLTGAAQVVAANNAMATSSAAAAGGGAQVAGSLAKSGPLLAGIALIAAGAAGMWSMYTERIKFAKEATEGFRGDAEAINKEFANFSASTKQAANDADNFAQRLKNLAAQGRDRNAFEFVIDVFFETDARSAAAIKTLTNDLKKEFDGLKGGIDNARDAVKNYNAAQDASGKNAEYVKAQITQQVKLLDALIQRSIQAREAELKRAAANGAGPRQDEVIQFQKLQKEIEKFKKMRDDLIKEAESKGIVLDVSLKTEGEEKVFTTINSLKEELKVIKDEPANAKIGEQGTAETIEKIKGLEGLIKFIEEDPVTVQIKAQFDIDKAAIASQIEYGAAMLDNVKSRANVEESIFGIYKSRNSYAITAAQAELQSMKDRGASAQAIKQKEAEIAQLKDNERKIEQAAIQLKLQNIGKEQELERASLELKQQGQRLDAQANIDAAELLATQAKSTLEIAKQNQLKAQATKDTTDDAPAAKLVEYARQYVDLTDKSVGSAKSRYGVLLQTQELERQTLSNQQAAARNNLNAQAAQVGLNSTIDTGATNYGKINTEAAGFISAGGRTIEITRSFSEGLGTAYGNAQKVNQEIASIPTNKSLNVDVAANINPQTISNSLAQAQANINKPGNELEARWVSKLDNTSFYEEVQRAKQQIQSSDGFKVAAQLSLEGGGGVATTITTIKDSLDSYKRAVSEVQIATNQVAVAQGEYNRALESGNPGYILAAAGNLKAQTDALASAKVALESVSGAAGEAAAKAEALGITFDGLTPKAELAATTTSKITESLGGATQQADQLTTSLSSATGTLETISGSVQTVDQQFQTTASNIAQDWSGALETASGSAQNLVESISGVSTEAGYAAGSIQSLSEATGGTAEGLNSAVESADELKTSAEGISEEFSAEPIEGFATALDAASTSAQGITDSNFSGAAEAASAAGSTFDSSLQSAATEANDIYSTLSSLDGLSPTVTVNVVGTQGRFAGGPVDSGSLYRVNELGKEAFLSASGRLSMINKPKNALWRAPSSGTVIPAHLAAGLNIPSNGVNVASGASRRVSAAVSNMSNSASIARAVTQALRASGLLETNNNAAANQAGQAVQLGKLTHAVNKLVDKDWNVQVNVKNPSPAAYVNMINRLS